MLSVEEPDAWSRPAVIVRGQPPGLFTHLDQQLISIDIIGAHHCCGFNGKHEEAFEDGPAQARRGAVGGERGRHIELQAL